MDARLADSPDASPFQFDTGSAWITAQETAPTPAIARALAVCAASRPRTLLTPAATEKASGVV